MKRLLFLFSALFLFASASIVSAQEVYEPQKGTEQRTQILNAVRPILEVRVGKPIEFVVNWLKVYQDWAFVGLAPQRPGGGEIEIHTPTYEPWEGQDGLSTIALLKFDYGQWNVVDYVIGATDVFWEGDPLYKQFPPEFIHP